MKAISSIAVLLIFCINILSQHIEDNLIMQMSYKNNLYDKLVNMVYVEQLGDINKAIVKQQGSNNNSYIFQQGNNLTITVNQTGNSNETNSWSVGENIYTEIYQNGNNNVVNNYVENHDLSPKFTYITQNGNNLECTAKQASSTSTLIIEQQSGFCGEGMKVEVSNSDFYCPLK